MSIKLKLPENASLWFRFLLFVCFFVVATLFEEVIRLQSEAFQPAQILQRLESSGDTLPLNNWEASLTSCPLNQGTPSECVTENLQKPLSFPISTNDIANFIKEQSQRRFFAKIRHVITTKERQWMEKNPLSSIVLIRNVQMATRAFSHEGILTSYGVGTNSELTIPSANLLQEGVIRLEFDFTGLPSFGPMESPILLSKPQVVHQLQSLHTRQLISAGLNQQLGVGFRLNIATLALVLDHSAVFGFLSLYGASRALRAFIPFLVDNGVDQSAWLTYLYCGFSGLSVAMLILFVWTVCHSVKPKLRASLLLIASCLIAFLCLPFIDEHAFLRADLYADGLGSLACVSLLTISLWMQSARDPLTTKMQWYSVEESDRMLTLRKFLIFTALLITLNANLDDLIATFLGNFKEVNNWRHSLLFPALTLAALLDVGFVSRKVALVSRELAEKAVLDKELELARHWQRASYPAKQFRSGPWEWRTFYHAASRLSGDWFDIREITFADQRKFFLVAVVDITGHGIASALLTSIVSSVWEHWCQELEQQTAPLEQQTRERLIEKSLWHIHSALSAAKSGGSGSGAFALIDLETREMSYLTAGHPPIVVIDGQRLNILNQFHPGLGSTRKTEAVWRAESIHLPLQSQLFFYTDGIVPLEQSVSMWLGRAKRTLAKGESNAARLFWNRVRDTRRTFQVSAENEDDITLLLISHIK